MRSQPSVLSDDLLFEILSNPRRRRLIYLLTAYDGSGDLREIAREIAAAEGEGPVETDHYRRVYISLYQTHIPKLERNGIVEYAPDEQEVTATDRIYRVVSILFDVQRYPWWTIYVGLAAVITIVFIFSVTMYRPDDQFTFAFAIGSIMLLGLITTIKYLLSTRFIHPRIVY